MQSDVWLTPPFIIDALGPFDLDPCAAPEPRPWQTANRHITLPVDGLGATWDSRVWLNPPYGGPNVVGPWMRKMAMHNYGTALIFARTETDLFIETVWRAATAIVFLFGRLFFHRADGIRACNNSGAPSCLIAYGIEDAYRLKEAVRRNRLNGYYIDLDQHCGGDILVLGESCLPVNEKVSKTESQSHGHPQTNGEKINEIACLASMRGQKGTQKQ